MAQPEGAGIGHSFPKLGGRRGRRWTAPQKAPRVKMTVPRSLNYTRIKAEVLDAVMRLPGDERAKIPLMGTLPEIMVAYALVKLKWHFQWQQAQDGGRLFLGGAVTDFQVLMGATVTIVRVMGDYWHNLPGRKAADAASFFRLTAKGYRVCDIWEMELYQAWVDDRLVRFVEEKVLHAG